MSKPVTTVFHKWTYGKEARKGRVSVSIPSTWIGKDPTLEERKWWKCGPRRWLHVTRLISYSTVVAERLQLHTGDTPPEDLLCKRDKVAFLFADHNFHSSSTACQLAHARRAALVSDDVSHLSLEGSKSRGYHGWTHRHLRSNNSGEAVADLKGLQRDIKEQLFNSIEGIYEADRDAICPDFMEGAISRIQIALYNGEKTLRVLGCKLPKRLSKKAAEYAVALQKRAREKKPAWDLRMEGRAVRQRRRSLREAERAVLHYEQDSEVLRKKLKDLQSPLSNLQGWLDGRTNCEPVAQRYALVRLAPGHPQLVQTSQGVVIKQDEFVQLAHKLLPVVKRLETQGGVLDGLDILVDNTYRVRSLTAATITIGCHTLLIGQCVEFLRGLNKLPKFCEGAAAEATWREDYLEGVATFVKNLQEQQQNNEKRLTELREQVEELKKKPEAT